MPKICYQPKTFRESSLLKIQQANQIITTLRKQGFTLTLRQLYYQFVKRNWIPNNDREYDKLGALMTDARLAGLVDWDAIEDRTRSLKGLGHWESPHQIIDTYADYFHVDRWADQQYRPEVWIEKEALAGIFARVCGELDIPYFSCRGYGSASEMWRAGQRMKHHIEEGRTPIIFHFGDHDPSGMDMTRDITERLEMFAEEPIEVVRVALNMDQIDEHQPPPNPAKITDSRCATYIELYGESSWELDALDPPILMDMVRDRVLPLRDEDEWERTGQVQQEGRDNLKLLADNYDKALTAVKGSK
jgi:hypothetical protein